MKVRVFWPLLASVAVTAGVVWPDDCRAEAAQESVFRFSLSGEPSGIDPTRISGSESNYFLVNVLRGLYFVDRNGVARPEIASNCKWVAGFVKLRCELKKNAKWSDGVPIRAQDFVDSWRRLLAPGSKGIGAALLSGVVNANAVYRGEAPLETLGIRAISESTLELTLEHDDREFVQRLGHPALAPTRTGFNYDRENAIKSPVSGPYRIVQWKTGSRIRLESNLFYETIQTTKVNRPPVEVLTIDDDETAFNLYRNGTLTLLRRLPTQYLKAWRTSKELFQIPVARFDYVGFGEELRAQSDFRHALASALNYHELKVIYSALGIPGCPGIEPRWMANVPCHTFNLKKAKKYWAKVPEELRKKRWTLQFSMLGGDDIKKGMEWMQSQWKKHLGATIDLRPVEQSMYLASLRKESPALFRKGVGMDRATCLAAVEIFSKSDPENFIRLDLPEYETAIEQLQKARTQARRKQACTNVVKVLIDRAEVIPLGRIHFSMLAKPDFSGWVVNPLNHLDLSRLKAKR